MLCRARSSGPLQAPLTATYELLLLCCPLAGNALSCARGLFSWHSPVQCFQQASCCSWLSTLAEPRTEENLQLLLPCCNCFAVLQETPSDVSVEVVPRSREVGQSYVTSVFTTLYALLFAARMVLRHRPQLVRICSSSLSSGSFGGSSCSSSTRVAAKLCYTTVCQSVSLRGCR